MENKPIIILKKPRAKQRVEIVENLEMSSGGWFLDVRFVEIKTEKIIDSHCIIKKDLDNWISYLNTLDWIVENNKK